MITAEELRKRYNHSVESETDYWIKKIEKALIKTALDENYKITNFVIVSRWSDIDYGRVVESILAELSENGYEAEMLNNVIINYDILGRQITFPIVISW